MRTQPSPHARRRPTGRLTEGARKQAIRLRASLGADSAARLLRTSRETLDRIVHNEAINEGAAARLEERVMATLQGGS